MIRLTLIKIIIMKDLTAFYKMVSFFIFSMISNMTFAEFSQKGRDQKCESCLYQNIRFFIYFMKKNAD